VTLTPAVEEEETRGDPPPSSEGGMLPIERESRWETWGLWMADSLWFSPASAAKPLGKVGS
jgi:hypothetical protein